MTVTNTAQPTIQTLQQQHIEIIKDVSCILSIFGFTLTFVIGARQFSSSCLIANTPSNHFKRINIYCFVLFSQKLTPESSGSSEIAGTSSSDDQEDKDGDKDSKKKKNRCGVCRKKVGLTGNANCFNTRNTIALNKQIIWSHDDDQKH